MAATVQRTDPTAAERARRRRERERAGIRVIPVEVSPDVVDALVHRGLIEPEDTSESGELGRALGELLDMWAEVASDNASRVTADDSAAVQSRMTATNRR